MGMPSSSRDFQRAARDRLKAAELLLQHKLMLDAMYLAGYTIECSLKALILELTPEAERPAKLAKISSGKKMHSPEVLFGLLRALGCLLPLDLAKRFQPRPGELQWSPALRYETGRRDKGETQAFLKTAKAVYDWVEGQLP
jgi:HEPN domain-containing protein